MNENRFGGVAPVREGEEYDVKIEAVGEKGDGIARVKGFVLFIASTKAGDEVRIRITKVLAKVGFAEVTGKIEKLKEESKPEKPKEPEVEYDESLASEDF